jgi:hypothetical protein
MGAGFCAAFTMVYDAVCGGVFLSPAERPYARTNWTNLMPDGVDSGIGSDPRDRHICFEGEILND